jgi:hypothetical protein
MLLAMRCAGPEARERSDTIVTTFCDSVTTEHEAVITGRRRLVTTEMGEAMAPASEYQPSGGTRSGVGAKLSLLIVALLVACGDDQARPTAQPTVPARSVSAADPATGVKTELDSAAPAFGDGVVAELTGDDAAARASYEQVLSADDVPTDVAARAALHLAQLEARAGKSGRARDLIARATALAPADTSVSEGADRVRAEIVAGSSAGDIRGPKVGTPLPGVKGKIAQAFAAAERALAHVHSMRPRQRLAVWEKEDATAGVVRRYRAIAEQGGVAQAAAEFRIGTLYHDLAIGLLVEPLGGELRRTLRPGAYAFLKKAVTAYKASLAVKSTPESEQWRLAAQVNLRAALDVLGETAP